MLRHLANSTELELSRTDLDELPLELLRELEDENTMPWFKKLRFGKKKNKKMKREISEPSSFKHCYHATVDNASGEFVGLPPQWISLVSSTSERPEKSPPSSRASSSAVPPAEASTLQPQLDKRTTAGACSMVESATSIGTQGSEETERGSRIAGLSEEEKTPGTDRSVSSSPVSTVTTREGAGMHVHRPVPIIRGSDSCLEETIKYIRKHYRSSSSASPYEEETAEERYVDIHFGSRSHSGSLMHLRGGHGTNSSTNSSHRTNYTSSSTTTMNNTASGPLASNSAFFMSAPHDLNIVQSDIGLYDCDTSSASNTTLFRSQIHSPSESSGYFGSTLSSLCSSRVSALSSIPQIHTSANTQPSSAMCTTPQYRCSTLRETSENPWLHHPQMKQGLPHFSSLQRPGKHRDSGPQVPPKAYAHGNVSSNVAAFTTSPPGHFGTTPRVYAHRPRGESVDNGLMYRYYRDRALHEVSRLQYNRSGGAGCNALTESLPIHACYSSSSQQTSTARNVQPPSKPRRQQRRPMTTEQFRTTLELLVNRSDPRKDLCELAKVGEGSTGVVYLAQQISTGKKVAVKKMNLRRQQRRELLFNEVRVCVSVCVTVFPLYFVGFLEHVTKCLSMPCDMREHILCEQLVCRIVP